ncbi:hypothetical protein R1sor_011654 [Riccia sorocarpa]|uniref:Uncharacterized protein n=1 Tax=Riccia sorocarpa TaxID=122646 RepID=A0ABD3I1L1_9MARC
MNVVQSKAWEWPMRRIVDRAITYPQGYGFLHRNRIKLDEVFNGNSGHSLIRSLLSWIPTWVRMLLGYLTETPPDVCGWESSLIIRRLLASVQIILSVDYLGPGSGSSKVDFARASSEEFPSVPICKISVATSYCKFLLEKGIPDMDLHCAEAAIEITIAHEFVHVATAYLFGEKRTPGEFPFIVHGGDPHSSFYCESHGNNGFIGLYRPSTPGRVVGVGMELIDRSEKRGVLDTWVSSYVAVRDYPDRLTNEVMDLEAQSIRTAFSDKGWIVQDEDARWCLIRKRDRTRYRDVTVDSLLLQRRLTFQDEYSQETTNKSIIGMIVRDSHGTAQVKSVTGSKVLRILKGHGLCPEIPEDLPLHREGRRRDKTR